MKTHQINYYGITAVIMGLMAFFIPAYLFGHFNYSNDVLSILNSKTSPVRDIYNYLFLISDISLIAFLLTKFRFNQKPLSIAKYLLVSSATLHALFNFFLPMSPMRNIRLTEDYIHNFTITLIVALIVAGLIMLYRYLPKDISENYKKFTLLIVLIIIVSGIVSFISVTYHANFTGVSQKVYLFSYLFWIFITSLVRFSNTRSEDL